MTHNRFDPRFIWAALGFALLSGFPLGTYVLFRLLNTVGSLDYLPALIQLHGHLQLMGWVGLFIMGVSLYFIPRFIGVPLRNSGSSAVLWLMIAGLVGQTAAWMFPAFTEPEAASAVSKSLALTGAIAELSGVVVYVFLVLDLYRRKEPGTHQSIAKLKPYFIRLRRRPWISIQGGRRLWLRRDVVFPVPVGCLGVAGGEDGQIMVPGRQSGGAP